MKHGLWKPEMTYLIQAQASSAVIKSLPDSSYNHRSSACRFRMECWPGLGIVFMCTVVQIDPGPNDPSQACRNTNIERYLDTYMTMHSTKRLIVYVQTSGSPLASPPTEYLAEA